MKTQIAIFATLLSLATLGTSMMAHCASAPDNENLANTMGKYLAQHGDFCVGKFDWPIDVSARDVAAHSNNAVQLPVLETMGLVSATDETVVRKIEEKDETVAVRRYALTAAGKKYYLQKDMTTATSSGDKVVHRGDFCAGKLSLDKIVSWDTPQAVGDHQETTVTYTYKIAAADWTKVPAAKRVFPMVERIVSGAGKEQLKQRVRSTPDGWIAVNMWEQ